MKLRNLLYFIAGGLMISTAACSHEEIELYSGPKAGIFIQEAASFYYGSGAVASYKDSMEFSFTSYDASIQSWPVRFVVRTMGNVVDYPRRYTLRIDTKGTTAIEGEEFSLSRNDYTIYPGESTDTCIVTLMRVPSIRKEPKVVKMRLEADENFDIIFDQYKNSGSWSMPGDTLSSVTYAIRFSETYGEPNFWKRFCLGTFGPFSASKFLEVNKLMGWTQSDWKVAGQSGSKIQYARVVFAANELRDYLQECADSGNPILDDDGSYMQLPADYEVDYSAYDNK